MEGSNNKVIFRVTRLANPGKTGRALAHNLREHSPEWADPEREKLNVYHGARTRGELKEAIKKRVDTVARKLRPDAVKAVEIFASYSKNALTDQNGHGYLKTVEDWLEKKYGKENVLSVAYHKDEEVPHLHAILTPIYKNDKGENALSAKKLFSGKKWMSNLQTEIWEKCGLPYGLDRGEIGSQATHRPLSEYRKDINARTPKFRVEIPPATLSRAKREEWAEEQNLKLKAATGKGFAQYQRERTQIFKENHSMSDKVKDYDRLKIELESEKERSKKLQEALNAKQKSYDYLGETLAYGSAKHIEIMKGNAQQYFKDNGQTLPRQLDEKNIDPKYQRGMDSDLGISL